ncbi:mitochondrial inner membrane protein Mitofilin [Mycena floridula]|nr:mitochondrial inner membrane protein Mitofilin [Mycena floridula]
MYRALQLPSTAGRGAVRATRRHFTTDAPQIPKKKPRIIRRILLATTTLVGTFYVTSTFVAFKHQPYYDFFSDQVPLGQSMIEYAESHHWDTATVQSVIESAKKTAISTQKSVMDKINGVEATAEKKTTSAKEATVRSYQDSKARVQTIASKLKTDVQKTAQDTTAVARHQAAQFSDEIQNLVQEAESALAGVVASSGDTKKKTETPAPGPTAPAASTVYDAPLPVGFEPPPGFARPAADVQRTLVPKAPRPPPLPLLVPALSDVSEPIISHLAGTIDNLASYAEAHPRAASQVTPVLETAKNDLSALAAKIEKVREDERAELEAKMDEQTREYTIRLLELDMAAQDKLDDQEDGFRKFFEEERAKMIESYREKLDNELTTQTELINERLKEEVIAQGIELQRRWIREVKVRVEQERGGRLAKLDELSAHLKRVERIALDNSAYLDDNIRIHALWSAIRTVSSSALSSPVRQPFREELRVLRHIATAREDPVVSAALESLEASEMPDIGVEPFADLASWFVTSVAPKVSRVALVPDTNAGVLSHFASYVLSSFQFKRQGLVPGDDVLSVVARAEYYLNEKDLDSAARELNQLKGTAKILLQDWLEAARRRLEVQQALEVVQTQATLASLLVV